MQSFDSICAVLEAGSSRILRVTDVPSVSVDYVGETASAVVDKTLSRSHSLGFTLGVWFDNEAGHVTRLLELVELFEQARVPTLT